MSASPTAVSAPALTAKAPDFKQIEALRRRMLFTVESMAKIYGVSRVTYYNWLKGTKVRRPEQVRKVTRGLLACVTDYNWPTTTVLYATQAERLELVQSLLTSFGEDELSLTKLAENASVAAH